MATKTINEIRVVDTQENTEVNYKAEGDTKKYTLGHSWSCTFGAKAIEKLQKAGFQVFSDKSCIAALVQVLNQYPGLNLTVEDFGRGVSWSTPESRERYKVFKNGVEYVPEWTEKQIAAIEASQNVPAMTVPAMADTTPIVPNIVPSLDVSAAQPVVQTPQPVTPMQTVPAPVAQEIPQPVPDVAPIQAPPAPVAPVVPQPVAQPVTPTVAQPVAPVSAPVTPTPVVEKLSEQDEAIIAMITKHVRENTASIPQLEKALTGKVGAEKSASLLKIYSSRVAN